MKTLFRMVVTALFFAGWGLAALSLHVVRTPTAIGLIPKSRLGLVDTYVDTRHWKMSDVAEHPVVIKRLLDANQADLLQHITGEQGKDLQGRLADALKNPQHYAVATTTRASQSDVADIISSAQASAKGWWITR